MNTELEPAQRVTRHDTMSSMSSGFPDEGVRARWVTGCVFRSGPSMSRDSITPTTWCSRLPRGRAHRRHYYGTGSCADLQAGMADRFRSLPMAWSAFLAGDTLAHRCPSRARPGLCRNRSGGEGPPVARRRRFPPCSSSSSPAPLCSRGGPVYDDLRRAVLWCIASLWLSS
jgi:hypothetical protein